MFDLKADPKLPHHYMFGVAMRDLHSKKPGELYLKYGPVYFTHEDIIKVQNASILSHDDLYKNIYKTSVKDAADICECRELIIAIWGMKMAAMSNHATLHHFSNDHPIHDYWNWFPKYVELANKDESIKEKIFNARVPGH